MPGHSGIHGPPMAGPALFQALVSGIDLRSCFVPILHAFWLYFGSRLGVFFNVFSVAFSSLDLYTFS